MKLITRNQRRALIAAGSGWMLDGMDVMLYSMVLTELMRSLEMSKDTAGLLQSLTLIASAVGGILFGMIADRYGRVRALSASILVYAVFTALSGLSRSVLELAVFRVGLGLGMGGEWAAGAALVAETWPPERRGFALGLMQSCFAVGYALAAGVTAVVLPIAGWRAVFFVGILPALFALWVRMKVEEPELWLQSRAQPAPARTILAELFRPGLRGPFILITLANAAAMFAWWGLFSWIPAYLALPTAEGGAGFDIVKSAGFIAVMQIGMWIGYVSFGWLADHLGRRVVYVGFLAIAAPLAFFYGGTRDPFWLLILGPAVALFGSGHFSGVGTITAELFPTRIRVTAQAVAYNSGRLVSAAAPVLVGAIGQQRGLGLGFQLVAAAFALAALLALSLPETRGTELR